VGEPQKKENEFYTREEGIREGKKTHRKCFEVAQSLASREDQKPGELQSRRRGEVGMAKQNNERRRIGEGRTKNQNEIQLLGLRRRVKSNLQGETRGKGKKLGGGGVGSKVLLDVGGEALLRGKEMRRDIIPRKGNPATWGRYRVELGGRIQLEGVVQNRGVGRGDEVKKETLGVRVQGPRYQIPIGGGNSWSAEEGGI